MSGVYLCFVDGASWEGVVFDSVWLVRHLPKLPRLLESEDVNMRIAAGETIALLFELARDMDPVRLTHTHTGLMAL